MAIMLFCVRPCLQTNASAENRLWMAGPNHEHTGNHCQHILQAHRQWHVHRGVVSKHHPKAGRGRICKGATDSKACGTSCPGWGTHHGSNRPARRNGGTDEYCHHAGVAGVGKSTAIKYIALAEFMIGTKIIFIDPEREYRELCENLGGDWINAAGGKGCMLPQLCIGNDCYHQIIYNKINFLFCCISSETETYCATPYFLRYAHGAKHR